MFNALCFPHIGGIAYPERPSMRTGKLDEWAARMAGPIARRLHGGPARDDGFLAAVTVENQDVLLLSDSELRQAAHALRPLLARDGFTQSAVARAFAVVREAARRSIGLRHFDVQLWAGRLLLRNLIVEMDTGEGKTLTATLPACTAALAGIPVHIVTVNDYLAARDAEEMGPIYRALGLTVGVIVQGMAPDARWAAYACDVTYCTNKELVFDYLKDRLAVARHASRVHFEVQRLMASEEKANGVLLRGLHYAIVDEADSVLVDEARTPLIIAGPGDDQYERHIYEQALNAARQLREGDDFHVDRRERTVRLTPAGQERAGHLTTALGGVWKARRRREEFLRQALTALLLFQANKQYVVHNEKVHIVDEYTGRIMPDRAWERGLHQLIEVKEGCPLGQRHETLVRISYQRFFRRYLRLAGMTGTAREVAGEVWSVYRLGVARVPTNRPIRRIERPGHVYGTAEEKWDGVVDAIASIHEQGRPVLVGTRSVAASEHLGTLLQHAGLPYRLLNARQDREEAHIIAAAGQAGSITVATNMAGRGTDIKLSACTAAIGGLHVIATERHDAHRIDRQLFGRCGRQGDPGTYEALLSLEDELVTVYIAPWWRGIGKAFLAYGITWPARLLFRFAQRCAERTHSKARRAVLKADEQSDLLLAFAGRME